MKFMSIEIIGHGDTCQAANHLDDPSNPHGNCYTPPKEWQLSDEEKQMEDAFTKIEFDATSTQGNLDWDETIKILYFFHKKCQQYRDDLSKEFKFYNARLSHAMSTVNRIGNEHQILTNERDELLKLTRLILPMAIGYAHANPVGSNQEYINEVQEFLEDYKEENDLRNRALNLCKNEVPTPQEYLEALKKIQNSY